MSLPLRNTVRAGDWLVVSGQVGHAGGTLVEGGAPAQAAKALENLVASLESAGYGTADVVKTTVFLTTMDDFAAMNAEYAKVFDTDPPARSAIAVHQLPIGAAVEIEAWAYKP